MDPKQLPDNQTQQASPDDSQGLAGSTQGKARGRPRKAAAPGHGGNLEGKSLTIPARPPVQQYTPEDGRKFAVLPAKAITDHNVTRQALRVLALVCLHANRNGFTWIGIQKMADLMGCTTAAIGKQMMELKALGYVEEVAAHYYGGPTARTATIRVVYDPTMSAEDVLARDSDRDGSKWEPVAVRANTSAGLSESTSANGEVVDRVQARPRPADTAAGLIAEVLARYRSEGLTPPTGHALEREAAMLASMRVRQGLSL